MVYCPIQYNKATQTTWNDSTTSTPYHFFSISILPNGISVHTEAHSTALQMRHQPNSRHTHRNGPYQIQQAVPQRTHHPQLQKQHCRQISTGSDGRLEPHNIPTFSACAAWHRSFCCPGSILQPRKLRGACIRTLGDCMPWKVLPGLVGAISSWDLNLCYLPCVATPAPR